MSTMMKKSLDPAGLNHSPLDTGAINQGADALKVKILHWPEEENFKMLVYKAVLATRGSIIGEDEKYDETVVAEAFSGGLNQCLEWVTVVFEIEGCSRGLTHELVRTRQGSFAQQTMRHTFMGYEPAVRMPTEIAEAGPKAESIWMRAMVDASDAYGQLVDLDVPFQSARTVLPIATETYVVAAYPLKVWLDTYSYRACWMFYPEIVALFQRMRECLIEKCPWLDPFIKISCERTAPKNGLAHQCTYQGWDVVEGQCPLSWAKEDNRVWKSSKFKS